MAGGLPLPGRNVDADPYWAAAREGRLLLQRSRRTGQWQFYPRHLMAGTLDGEIEWAEASGRGTVHSFSIIHRAPTAAFEGRVPYVIALIDLEEGPRMLTNIVGGGALEVAIGDPVEVCFEEREGGFKLPQFRRAEP